MRTIIAATLIITMLVSVSYAFGDRFGFKNFGGDKFGASKFGSGGEAVDTYWNSPTTDRWDVAQTALWNTTMNTEIV